MRLLELNCGPDDFEPDNLGTLLDRHGILLLRHGDWDIPTFEVLASALCDEFHGVGIRKPLKLEDGDGFTTEVFRYNHVLLGHAEGAYLPHRPPPDVCFFLCLSPPTSEGGETTLVDGMEMLAGIPVALRQRLETLGVIYACQWDNERWGAEFGLQSESELREFLSSLAHVQFRLESGMLSLCYKMPAVTLSHGGVKVFANGVLAHLPCIDHPRYKDVPVYARASNGMYFGDGEPFSNSVTNTLIDVHDQMLYRHRWQKNDVLIIDNTRYMHGRLKTRQPCERILASRFGWLHGRTGFIR